MFIKLSGDGQILTRELVESLFKSSLEKQATNQTAILLAGLEMAVTNSVKAALGTKVLRNGSAVSSEDYHKVFKFIEFPLNMQGKNELLCWSLKQLERFKVQAKVILTRYFQEKIIVLANEPNSSEVRNVEPVLRELLHELLPVAFPTSDVTDLSIGRFEYHDAVVEHSNGTTYVYNGATDLSIFYRPQNICIGGFENKVSKKSIMHKDDSKMNSTGIKAVAQTGTQILGAAKKLKRANAVADNISMIATNGWQWVYVKRTVQSDGECAYYHCKPISLGGVLSHQLVVGKQCADKVDEESVSDSVEINNKRQLQKASEINCKAEKKSQQNAAVKSINSETNSRKKKALLPVTNPKPLEDICFDEVCHLLAMMFDNVEFLWGQLKTKSLWSTMEMLSIKEDDRHRDSSSNGDSDERDDHNDENRGVRGPTTTRVGKVSGSVKGKGKFSGANHIGALGGTNNINKQRGLKLTVANMMRLNLGM